MSLIKLTKVYEVPSWRSEDGSLWHKHLHSLHFAREYGHAAGFGQLLFSRNGGKSWANQMCLRMNHGIRAPERVFSIDRRNAWVLILAHQAKNNCFYTHDGGKEWHEKRLASMVHPNDIFFLTETFGWIISDNGDVPAGEAMIHITADGGSRWQSHPLEIKGAAKRLKFLTPQRGLLIQHTTNEARTRTVCNILLSRDGGHTWRVLKAFNRLITDLCFLDEDRFFVVGEGGFISGTTDGGLNWKRSYVGTRDVFNVIEFNGRRTLIAAGDFGLLLTSGDEGTHWIRHETSDDMDNIVDLSFVDDDHAVFATSTSIFSMTFY